MKIKKIFIFIVSILVGIVFLQNMQVVTVKFLFWDVSMSRIILLPLVMLGGFIIGFFVGRTSW